MRTRFVMPSFPVSWRETPIFAARNVRLRESISIPQGFSTPEIYCTFFVTKKDISGLEVETHPVADGYQIRTLSLIRSLVLIC